MDWVSVDDKLPRENTPVLVYIADRGTVILTHFYTDFCLAMVDVKNGFREHGVTHWVEITPPNAAVVRQATGTGDCPSE